MIVCHMEGNILNDDVRNIAGPVIKRLREKHELSQSALVRMLADVGISMSTASLSKIETQKRGVSDIELRAFSELFEVPVESLLKSV